ncbi:solute carrier family 35 member [Seminavis robusta]|uniref:Solute carrier family 35 member n=1 Tax=Seminavis robusta TaxID=568900 RepID=A0A9N8EJ69_9STRA|nr:solute carrier family 35 member [Seminavis robusta]|eukprot:Sro1327_g263070.1 solute carrier family 35 member (214) ;mRNA; r:1230-2196
MVKPEINKEALFWLVVWTANNVGVTLLNKAAFAKVDFHYPYFLSFVHMVCNSIGSQGVFWSIRRDNQRLKAAGISEGQASRKQLGFFQRLLGNITRKELDPKGRQKILAFSVIFSLNIAIGNVSLRHVSVNFNQVMRSLVPALTIGMGLALKKPVSAQRIFKRQLASPRPTLPSASMTRPVSFLGARTNQPPLVASTRLVPLLKNPMARFRHR